MGAFLGDTVDEIVVTCLPPVKLIAETGGGYDRSAGGLAGKPEHKAAAVPEEVLVNHQQDGFFN